MVPRDGKLRQENGETALGVRVPAGDLNVI